MGNTIRKAVKIDDTTMTVRRGRYARVCVEVNLEPSLVPFIIVLACQQQVEYEGLHPICFECGKYRHRVENCSRNYLQGVGQRLGGSLKSEEVEIQKGDSSFGPWMLPKYSRRKLNFLGNGRHPYMDGNQGTFQQTLVGRGVGNQIVGLDHISEQQRPKEGP